MAALLLTMQHVGCDLRGHHYLHVLLQSTLFQYQKVICIRYFCCFFFFFSFGLIFISVMCKSTVTHLILFSFRFSSTFLRCLFMILIRYLLSFPSPWKRNTCLVLTPLPFLPRDTFNKSLFYSVVCFSPSQRSPFPSHLKRHNPLVRLHLSVPCSRFFSSPLK